MKDTKRININPFSYEPFPCMDKKELICLLLNDLEAVTAESISISILNGGADIVVISNGITEERIKRIVESQKTGIKYIINIFSKVNKYHLIQSTSFKFILEEIKKEIAPF